MSVKEVFKQFLIGYVAAGHTATSEALEELDKLTKNFVNSIPEDYYFKCDYVKLYCEHMLEVMSDENKGFFHFYLDKARYNRMLIDYLVDSIHLRSLLYSQNDESD